jgi:hypothetical protein
MAAAGAEALLADEGWVRRHSRWRFWTWTLGFFGWVAFLWIGYQARRQRWILYGVLYAIPFIFAMAFADDRGGRFGRFVDDQVMPLSILVVGVVGILHARRLLPEYLAIRARQEAAEGSDDAAVQARRFLRPGGGEAAAGAPAPGPTGAWVPPIVAAAQADAGAALAQEPDAAPEAPADPAPAGVVDVNTAPEDQLAALPGVGVVLARRAVAERERSGPFASVDAFAELLELRPHILERLRPRLRAGAARRPPPAPRGRVVDF